MKSADKNSSLADTTQVQSLPTASQLIPRPTTALTALTFLLVAIEPAAAQTNAICSADRLPGMIEGFFQLTTAIGLMGVVVVWQADSLADMFTLNRDQKEGLKRHKRQALKSAVILLVLGPLYTVAGSVMNLPLASCVDLVPW